MNRKSSSSKRAANETKKVDAARAALPGEIDDIEKGSKAVESARVASMKSKTNNIDTPQGFWARLKNWLADGLKWLAIRPLLWLVIIAVLFLVYVGPLSYWQWSNRDKIQSIMQTATAQVLQMPIPTVTETPTPAPIP